MTDWPRWVCPEHRSALVADGAELRCAAGHMFSVVDGVPRFVSGPTYSDAFGAQWKRYRRTQLDSHTRTTLSHDRTRRCLGEALWADLEGSQVLEAGCGAGRFTEVLLERGAFVTSVDMSTAVEANAQNFPPGARHRIAQADLLRLPLAQQSFDVVFCLGVIQHTPDPERAIAALYDQVRPAGALVFDHYGRLLQWRLSTGPLFRAVLKRTAPNRGLAATERIVRLLLPLHRRFGSGHTGTLLRRISPVQVYYHAFPELSDQAQAEWALLDTHDALTDWYKHFRTPESIERTLRELGLDDVHVARGGNGVEARGRRPGDATSHAIKTEMAEARA